MADIYIDHVGSAYTGTDTADDIQNRTGNLRDITVAGLSGSDILHLGSAAQGGTGNGGIGLGFSLGSSELSMGAGDDTLTFSGQAGSGFAKFNVVSAKGGAGDDFIFINGLASASASVIKGNEGADDITFASDHSAGASNADTANAVVINGNAGADSISAVWTGTETTNFRVAGGADNDTIVALFNDVNVAAGVTSNSGAAVRGNKGADEVNVQLIGTSHSVRVNGNSGADTIVVTAAEDITQVNIAGGQGNDSVSAVYVNGISALDGGVNGSLGNDTVNLTLSTGGYASALTVGGGSGDDSITLNINSAAAAQLGSANHILGGTGADTITLNIAGDVNSTGVSAFVADLGVAGAAGNSGGTLDLNISAVMSGGTFRFRGTTAADTFTIGNPANTGGGDFAAALNDAVFSAEGGNDSITVDLRTGGAFSAVNVLGGAGNDLITASIGGDDMFGASTAGRVSVQGGAGNDTMVINVGETANITAGSTLSAGFFGGDDGDDSITINVASAGFIAAISAGSQFFGGSGADTIGLSIASGASAAADIQAGSGADLITATVLGFGATAGDIGGTTALAGAGNDTIAVTFIAAETGGAQVMSGGEGAVFNGGAGTDSINLLGTVASAGTFWLGEGQGAAGADTITLGTTLASTGTTVVYGAFNGGLGSDSLVFSGNNIVSGAVSTFQGAGSAGSGGFVYASGDSLINGFDTIFVSNEAITGGQVQQAGTFGSAGILFQSMTGGDAVGDFNMSIATAGARDVGISAGQALFKNFADSAGARLNDAVGIATGGVVANVDQISAGEQGHGAFVASGGSTTAQIFSAVEGLLAGRGQSIAFNIQNGSAGTVDGYIYVDNGGLTDTVIKFAGNGLNQAASQANSAGLYFRGGGGDSAGFTQAGVAGITRAVNAESGGSLYLGANVGVG